MTEPMSHSAVQKPSVAAKLAVLFWAMLPYRIPSIGNHEREEGRCEDGIGMGAVVRRRFRRLGANRGIERTVHRVGDSGEEIR
jgi:hypothetical protein